MVTDPNGTGFTMGTRRGRGKSKPSKEEVCLRGGEGRG